MPDLRKALMLSTSDWLLIARATLWFALVDLGLRVLSLRTLLDILDGKRRSTRHNQLFGSPERCAYCVELASRLHPLQATCLKKALVLFAMLRRGSGVPTPELRIMIGAARVGNQLDAHAWLEYEGRIILGARAPGRYSNLFPLEMVAETRPQ